MAAPSDGPQKPHAALPENFLHTTATERGSFRDCRRRWYLENIELLEPSGSAAWNLMFGSVVHEALDAYYRNQRDVDMAVDAFNTAWEVDDKRLAHDYGGLYSQGIEQEWYDHKIKGQTMLKYYDQHDRQSNFFDTVVEVGLGFDAWRQNVTVEERQFVEILGWDGEATGDLLSGRIDLVVKRPDGLWIVDHKTAASAPAWRALELDDQLTAYCYIFWRITGNVPRGALYNVLLKDPPKPPRVLRDGTLSKAKDQRTTFDLYVAAIQELGQPLADYEEFLNFLAEKGWNTFFPRDGMNRNIHEIRNFERQLAAEREDMKRALSDERYRYKNANQRTCSMCSVVSICQAMEDGSDVEAVKEQMYQKKQPRHTIPSDLVASIQGRRDNGTE